MESVIRRCDWSRFGLNIDGTLLNHLRFADDIVLITSSPEEASEMLDRLDQEGSQYGLTMNTSKTKVMRNRFAGGATVTLKGSPIEDVFNTTPLVTILYGLLVLSDLPARTHKSDKNPDARDKRQARHSMPPDAACP
ncbi:hypothetical protein COOONC_07117 [Cooperia oncophora]